MGALHRIDPGLPVAPLDPARTTAQMTQDVFRLLAADHLFDDADGDLSNREAAGPPPVSMEHIDRRVATEGFTGT